MAQTLNQDVIKAAIEGFESQKIRIDQQLSELRAMLNGAADTTAGTSRKGRRMSDDGRARIAEAQRRRWAVAKAEAETTAPAPTKRKRKLSAEGRAAIVAALKKRWAAKKAGPAKKTATAKKAAPKKATKRSPAKKAARKTTATPAPASNAAAQ
jgi:hypothetical protein